MTAVGWNHLQQPVHLEVDDPFIGYTQWELAVDWDLQCGDVVFHIAQATCNGCAVEPNCLPDGVTEALDDYIATNVANIAAEVDAWERDYARSGHL